MHFSPWLISAALFSSSTLAFYPWVEKSTSKGKHHGRRFYPWIAESDGEDKKAPTLAITKRPTKSKRDNEFPVVLASAPTMKDSMAINEDGLDFSYFSTITFGSKNTELWMLIDTGAANTWVMGSSCTTAACENHDTYGSSDSTSLNATTDTWNVTYGTGAVNGVLATDKVSFASFDVELGFGLASNASSDFTAYPFDGIMGLGRPDSDSIGTPTVMQVLDSANVLQSNIVAIHLQRNSDGATDGEITFGATDSSKYTGDLSYTSTVSSTGLWEIPVDGCGFKGQSTGLSGRTAIIDTGTSYILLPPPDAAAIHAQFPSATLNSDGETYTISCDMTAPVQFTFSGVTYDVSPKDYIGSATDSTSKTCTSNIIAHQAFGAETWLLGDVFLKSVYSVFDFDKDRIGFAVSAPVSKSSTSTTLIPSATAVTSKSSPTSTSGSSISSSSGKSTPTSSSSSSTKSALLPASSTVASAAADSTPTPSSNSSTTRGSSQPTNNGAPLGGSSAPRSISLSVPLICAALLVMTSIIIP